MKNLLYNCIAVVLLLATGVKQVQAQTRFPQQSYTTTNIKSLGTMVVNDTMALYNMLTSVPQSNTSWHGNYCFDTSHSKGAVILKIRDDLMGQTVPESFTCNVTVAVTKWGTYQTGSSMPAAVNTTLSISYDKRTGISYNESDIRIYNDAQYIGVKLVSISNPSVKNLLELQLKIDGVRYYCKPNFNMAILPCMLKTEYLSGSDEWRITFDETSILQQADEFDVEWTFVDFYDEASYHSGASQRDYSFKNNSTRVVLGKNQRTFSVRNIFEKGFVVFRYRTVAYYTSTDYSGEPVVQRLTGAWSIADAGDFSTNPADLKTSGCFGVKNSLAIIDTDGPPHLPLMNWQYISVFAEEGKKKETISYYDGSMRGRQTIASNNADQTVLVQENIYDYNGRAAIQVLPVPVDGSMSFYANLNKANSTTPYTAANFDLDVTGNICASATAPLDSNAGNSAAHYYSYNNSFKAAVALAEWDFNKFIPVAGGFPFTQTVFMNDNTGRVAAQSGVGYMHRIDGAHATRYAYETPHQEELTRLFGTDVGYAAHYKKSTTFDANGQASVSYTDLKGHVIATALAANPTGQNGMIALDNNAARTGIEVSLLNPSEVSLKEGEYFYSKRITVLETGNYKFKYSVQPQDYMPVACEGTTPCYDCRYDLDITITNLCGEQVLDGDNVNIGTNVLHREIGGGTANSANYSPSCSTNAAYSFATDPGLTTSESYVTVSLQPGTYTIQRTLKINEKAYRLAEEHYMTNSVCKTFEQFLTEAESAMDMSGCYVTCESCSTQFANTDVSSFLSSMATKLGHTLSAAETAEWTAFYNDTKRKCDELSCGKQNQCDVIKNTLITDITPGGQYAAYDYIVTDNNPPVFTVKVQTINVLNQATIYALPSTLKADVDGVLVNANTLTSFDFVKYWDPIWADELIKLHPEYCEYDFCKVYEDDAIKELEILNTETYDEAVTKGYMSGTSMVTSPTPGPAPLLMNGTNGYIQTRLAQYKQWNFDPNTPSTPSKANDNSSHYISAEEMVLFGMFYADMKDASMSYVEFSSMVNNARIEFSECNSSYEDLYWTQLKEIYLSEHKALLNALKPGTCTPVAVPSGMAKRFYSAATEWPGTGGAQPDAAYVQGTLADHCETQCESYKEIWADNLAGCDLNAAELADLLDQLKEVCINGCDENFPLGASSVAPAKMATATHISFEDVIRKFRYGTSNTPAFDSKLCTDLLITMPAPYGHDYFGKSSPFADTCACDNETAPEHCPCSTSTAYNGPNNTAVKLLRTDVAEEDKCDHCVECSETANAFYDFTTVYPMEFNESPAYDKTETRERLIKHFNKRLGLNLSYEEYEAHLAACLGYASVPANADVFALYAETYQLVQTRSMKENGLIAASFAIPRENRFKYEDHEQWVDGYVVDYTYTKPVYASINDQLMYIENIASLFDITFKTLHYTSIFFQLDCLCPKVLDTTRTNSYVVAPSTMLTNPDGATDQAYLNRVYSICKDWQKSMEECMAENGRKQTALDFSGPDDECTEVYDRIADLLRNEPLNIGYTNYAKEQEGFDCVTGLGEGGQYPRSGGIGGSPNAHDCQFLMPFFVTYYTNHIASLFDPSEISKTDLKVFLCNNSLFGDTEFEDLIDAMNAHGANIDVNGTRQEQTDRLWSILKMCRTASCQSFMDIATDYDTDNQSALITAGKGLHDLAAEGSMLKVYTDFREELNRQLNKPPYLTFFDDATITKHFQSCAKGPCEIVTETLADMRTEHSSAFAQSGLSTTQIMRLEITSVNTMMNDFLATVNPLLARAPYFKTMNRNMLIAAVEMCEECITQPIDLQAMNVVAVINELMGPATLTGPSTAPVYASAFKYLMQSGWKVKDNAPNIADMFFAKSAYKNQVKYQVVGRAANNSWMYGEARPPAGNYFYVKIATIEDNGSASVDPYNYLPVTPGGDFAFANITAITANRLVRLSAFEIQVIATATYKSMLTPSTNGTQKILITMPSYAFYKDYVSGQTCKHNNTVCNKPVQQFTVTVSEDPCITRLKLIAKANAYYNYNAYVAGLREKFRTLYVTKCMSRSDLNEQFNMKYDERQYQYTLYYYDQAGNLVKTVPPAGLAVLNATDVATADTKRNTNQPMSTSTEQHNKITRYQYNTLNQLIWQKTPDAGESKFWYDKVGRIVLSQNAKQYGQTIKQFSYTFYDGLGRITETGQLQGLTNASPSQASIRGLSDFNTWVVTPGQAGTSVTRSQLTRTFYDAYNGTYASAPGVIAIDFTNLRGRVVHSAYYESASLTTPQTAVHYSYDIHGNVKTLYRETTELSPLEQSVKQVDYEYDLISGKVNRVIYQDGEADQYIHEYRYDQENRLVTAKTGSQSGLVEEDANYYYYLHGPMARMEYGAHDVQGLDYTYTIQGWLKSVNAPTLDYTRDPGRDGYASNSANRYNARDVFGFELSYYKGDYNPVYGFTTTQFPQSIVPAAAAVNDSALELFNGNIRYMVTAVNPFSTLLSAYSYDQLNRLKRAAYFDNLDRANNAWGTGAALTAYQNTFKYDADGNILTQMRNGKGDNLNLDDLSYVYEANTNKLVRVDDTRGTSQYTDDIDDQSGTNYTYDYIGNLTGDAAEEIQEIRWNVYGKITNIIRTSGSKKPDLIFAYTPDGHRAVKTVIPKNGLYPVSTYYVRDAQGNVLATYSRKASKIIDYDALTYAAVNTKLSQLIGDAYFGEFIAQLHTVHVPSTGFTNAVDAAFRANTGSLDARLREMPPYGALNYAMVYTNWVLTQLDQPPVLQDVFDLGSGNMFPQLYNCLQNESPTKYLELISVNPQLALSFMHALCQFDQSVSSFHAKQILTDLYSSGNCPLDPGDENNVLTALDPLNDNVHSNYTQFVDAIVNRGLSSPEMEQVFNMMLWNNPQAYYEALAAMSYHTMAAKWTNYTNCGGSQSDVDDMLQGYATEMLKALYRYDAGLFISLVNEAGYTHVSVGASMAQLLLVTPTNLATYMDNIGLNIGSNEFAMMMLNMYLLDRTRFNDLMSESFMSATYTSTCATTDAYPCIGSSSISYNLQLSNVYGDVLWDHLYKLNTAYNYAGMVKLYDPYNYLLIAGKYHISDISTYQQANPTLYGSSNGMYQYFNYIRSLTGTTTYNAMINHFMTESDTYSDTLKLEEWMLYGSSRLGSQQSGKIIAAVDYTATYSSGAFSDVDYNLAWKATYSTTAFPEVRGSKRYELTNHLGNVLAVVSDKKLYHDVAKQYLNFDFATRYGTMLPASVTISLSGGKLNASTTSTSQIVGAVPVQAPAGKSYKVSFDLTMSGGVTGVNLQLVSDYASGSILQNSYSATTAGTHTYTITSPNGLSRYKFQSTGIGTFTLDNFKIEEYEPESLYYMAEVIRANDYSPFGAPLAGRSYEAPIEPLVSTIVNYSFFTGSGTGGWQAEGTGVTIVQAFDNLKTFYGSGGSKGIKQTFATETGKTYRIRFMLNAPIATNRPMLRVYDKTSGIELLKSTSSLAPGDYIYTVKASSIQTELKLVDESGTAGEFFMGYLVWEEVTEVVGVEFGYQGSEQDNDIYGGGNSYTTFYRELDPRLGRWMSIDPKAMPWESPYSSMSNSPIRYNDILGDKIRNGYEDDKKAAETKVSGLQSQYDNFSGDKDSKEYKKLGEQLNTAKNELQGILVNYNDVQQAIADLEKYNNDAYKKLDNLTDAGGKQVVDVYIFQEAMLKDNFFDGRPTGEGVDGLTNAVPDGMVTSAKNSFNPYYAIKSIMGPNTATVVLNSTSMGKGGTLSHEAGHVLYQVKNMVEYVQWLTDHPGVSVGGHGGGDPSGEEAHKQAEIYRQNEKSTKK